MVPQANPPEFLVELWSVKADINKDDKHPRPPSRLNRRRASRRKSGAALTVVPGLNVTTTLSKTFRYRCVGGTAGNTWVITFEDNHLLRCLSMGLTATTAGPIFSGYKVKAIDLYLPPIQPAAGTTVDMSNQWIRLSWSTAASNADDYIKPECKFPATASLSGISRTRFVPPKGSLASFWRSDATGEDIFTLTGTTPAGGSVPTALVDVHLELTLNDLDHQEGSVGVTSITVGQLCQPRVSGTNSSVGNPVGYPDFQL